VIGAEDPVLLTQRHGRTVFADGDHSWRVEYATAHNRRFSPPLFVQSGYLLAWARACSSRSMGRFSAALYPMWTRTCYV
jgi:hypothetical protein